jgi:hypothetical protein
MQGATVHEHELTLCSKYYTPVDEQSVPTGAIEQLEDGPLHEIGGQLGRVLSELPDGLDLNFVLSTGAPNLRLSGAEALPGALIMCCSPCFELLESLHMSSIATHECTCDAAYNVRFAWLQARATRARYRSCTWGTSECATY